jgi:hypothetical protein
MYRLEVPWKTRLAPRAKVIVGSLTVLIMVGAVGAYFNGRSTTAVSHFRLVDLVEQAAIDQPVQHRDDKSSSGAIKLIASIPVATVADVLHQVRVQNATNDAVSISRRLRTIMDYSEYGKAYPGAFTLFHRLPYGWFVRRAESRGPVQLLQGEVHTDQLLASFAEVGVPLDAQIDAGKGCFTVQDLLESSRRAFVQSVDSPWSLVAYALYLPNEPTWRDRFGRSWSYERIADFLLKERIGVGPCGGTHVLYALCCLRAVDRQLPCLTSSCRAKVDSHLLRVVDLLARRQRSDGSWGYNWAADETADDRTAADLTTSNRLLLITAHHVEWMTLLPSKDRSNPESLRRAIRFLQISLANPSEREIVDNYCAYSHAACVLARVAHSEEAPIASMP